MKSDQKHWRSLLASWITAALVVVLLAVWFALDAMDVNLNPTSHPDGARVGTAMVFVFLAAFASVASMISALFPLVRGDLRPLISLVVIACAWAAFLFSYDHALL